MWKDFKRFLNRGWGIGVTFFFTLSLVGLGFLLFLLISAIIQNWDTPTVVLVLKNIGRALLFIVLSGSSLFILSLLVHYGLIKIDDRNNLKEQRKIFDQNAKWEAEWKAKREST